MKVRSDLMIQERYTQILVEGGFRGTQAVVAAYTLAHSLI